MPNSTPWYQWVFSGIGVALLSWFVVWVYRVYRRYRRTPVPEKRSESASQVNISDSTVIGPFAGRDISIGTFVQQHVSSESQDDEYRPIPTPMEIAEAISKVPLYLRSSVANSYSGLKVRWQANIQNIKSILPRRDGQIDVCLSISDAYIIAPVKLDDYPILKTVRGGEPVEVMGTIDWVEENALIHLALVHLKDVKLKFPPQ